MATYTEMLPKSKNPFLLAPTTNYPKYQNLRNIVTILRNIFHKIGEDFLKNIPKYSNVKCLKPHTQTTQKQIKYNL